MSIILHIPVYTFVVRLLLDDVYIIHAYYIEEKCSCSIYLGCNKPIYLVIHAQFVFATDD